MSASPSINRLSESRITGWSSTTSTRISLITSRSQQADLVHAPLLAVAATRELCVRVGAVARQREGDRRPGLVVSGADVQRAAGIRSAGRHVGQTVMLDRVIGRDPATVIRDRQ